MLIEILLIFVRMSPYRTGRVCFGIDLEQVKACLLDVVGRHIHRMDALGALA